MLCVVVVGAIVLATGDEQPDTDAVVAPATTAASMPGTDPGATPPTTPTTPTTTPDTSASATTPAPTTPGTSAPTTTATTTTTTNTATTTTTTTPDTTAPTTTAAPTPPIGEQPGVSISAPTSATDADGRRLTVTPRIDACSSGPECLVVAFAIEGFATQPTTFVCEFASGNRYEFRFGSDRVDPACSTGDTPDSIVVEVDGLRSEPITIAD